MPATTPTETGSTVIAHIHFQHIAAHKVIIQTSEEAGSSPFSRITVHARSLFFTFSAQSGGQVKLPEIFIFYIQSVFGYIKIMQFEFFRLETTHKFDVMLVGKRMRIRTIDIQVQIILLLVILFQARILAGHNLVPLRIIVIGRECSSLSAFFLDAIVKLYIGDPVLNRLDDKSSLMVVPVSLLGSLSTLSQCTGIIMVDVPILIINRHIRPVTTSQAIIKPIYKAGRSPYVITSETGRIVEFQPVCQSSIDFSSGIETLQAFFSKLYKSFLIQIVE